VKDTLEELVSKTLAVLNSFEQQLQSINPLNAITNKDKQSITIYTAESMG
jgi:hypothetical protein